MLTKREVFEKVAAHLLAQNERSTGDQEFCKYRGKRGLKCAIGCLIPDEVYSPEMESHLSNDDVIVMSLKSAGVPTDGSTVAMLRDLQVTHDGKSPEEWPQALRNLRIRYFEEA